MVDIEFVRKKHMVDGWSIRKISRQLGMSRQSVRKALQSADLPKYHLSQPRPCPVMDQYRDLILTWLGEDEKAPPKQRHTAKRIHDRLSQEYHHHVPESTVRNFVSHLRRKPPEVFIPLEAGWGQEAQVDWGQALVRMAGEAVVAHLFCLRMRASAVPFVWAAPTEKLEALLEGHCRAFDWLGGVPAECRYDNPKTAVVRILAGPHREEHAIFASLRAHYLFDSHFCGPGQGHEKGAVENLVGYVRRNALVPVPELANWDALNAHLLAWCEGERTRLGETWAKEQAGLRPLPAQPFRPALTRLAPVNSRSLVTVDHNRYSVPCEYVGRSLHLAIFATRLEAWDGQHLVATHTRSHRRGETILVLEHYLPALARKPRASMHAAVVSQLPPIYAAVRDKLCQGQPEGYREFTAMLLLHREFPASAVAQALQEAWDRGCLQVSAVRQILLNQTTPPPPAPVAVPQALEGAMVSPPDLAAYDTLLSAGQQQGVRL
jgi:transposase